MAVKPSPWRYVLIAEYRSSLSAAETGCAASPPSARNIARRRNRARLIVVLLLFWLVRTARSHVTAAVSASFI
jgi:hypothetical protein